MRTTPLERLEWAQKHICVQDADADADTPEITFRANSVQRKMWLGADAMDLKPGWDITVYARQIGKTTNFLVNHCTLMRFHPGRKILLVCTDEDTAKSIRRKWQVIVRSAQSSPGSGMPAALYDNLKDFTLTTGSSLLTTWVGEKESKAANVGRSDTLHLVHLCEVGFWKNAEIAFGSLSPAIKLAGHVVIIDSTPPTNDDLGGIYRTILQKHLDGDLLNSRHWFEPWWTDPQDAYRLPFPARDITAEEAALGIDPFQISWRRMTMREPGMTRAKFLKSYPEQLDDALRPGSGYAFSDATIAHYEAKKWEGPIELSLNQGERT